MLSPVVVLAIWWVLRILSWVLIVYAVLSWCPPNWTFTRVVYEWLNEGLGPILRPFRRLIPPVGGLDLSLLVIFVVISVLQQLVLNLL